MLSSAGNAVLAALAADILVALPKFAAARHTGSSAMPSEGVHSAVDARTEILLLHGLRTSRQAYTAEHPLGLGQEVFFWNFIVRSSSWRSAQGSRCSTGRPANLWFGSQIELWPPSD